MADDRSHGAKRSWRGKAEPDRPERPVRTEKSSYKWTDRGTKPGAGGRPTGSHRVRLFAGLAAFTTCLGVVVWLIWMLNSTRPAGVVLLGADYAKNLAVPHNALGYRGLKGIEDLSRAPTRWTLFKPARLELIRDPGGRNVLETADDWAGRIAALKKGFGEPTLILVLALHGGSDSGGAYLMPNQFKRPEDRLDMRAVIASMKELPPEKAKVLVVEGSQVESDWRLGMLHNDFARRLKELEPEIRAVPNLWVLSGCDEDQRCWASEGLGRTIFHYYITEALRGGSAAGTDGRLSLEELYRYVRENVRGWAWTARGAVQEPILIPDLAAGARSGADGPARRDPASVHLATVEAAPSAEASPPLERDALTDAWLGFRRLDAMVPHPSAYSPLRWRAYGATLVRYEQLLLAGSAEAAQPVGEQLSQLKQAIAKDRMLIGLSASAGVNLVMDQGRDRPDRIREDPPVRRRSSRPEELGHPPDRGGCRRGRRPRPGPAAPEPTGRVPSAPGPGGSGQVPGARRGSDPADRTRGRPAPGRVPLPADAPVPVSSAGGATAVLPGAGGQCPARPRPGRARRDGRVPSGEWLRVHRAGPCLDPPPRRASGRPAPDR
jgi:hypothetical protein